MQTFLLQGLFIGKCNIFFIALRRHGLPVYPLKAMIENSQLLVWP
jgi:hypothetical protein